MFEKRRSELLSWEAEKKKLNFICSTLKDHGILIKPGSRLFRYQRIVDALDNSRPNQLPKGFKTKHFHQIAIEIHQLSFVVEELCNSIQFDEWSKKFSFLVSGNELPEDDTNHFARNYQFELFVAGIFQKARLKPLCEEPDIVIEKDEEKFGVAVKRPNSFKQLDKNLRKGRDQIINPEVPGILFLDMSLISNPNNYICIADDIESVTDLLIKYLDLFSEANINPIRNIIDNKMVFGIIFHLNALCDLNNRLGHCSRIAIKNLCSQNSPHFHALEYIANALKKIY